MDRDIRPAIIGAIATIVAAALAFLLPKSPTGEGGSIGSGNGSAALASGSGASSVSGNGSISVGSGRLSISLFTPNTCTDIDGKWNSCADSVKDKNGVVANLITVISRDMYWRLGSDSVFEYNGKEENLVDHINSKGMQSEIGRFEKIVTVGAASYEMTSGLNPLDIENERAYRRAMRVQLLLKDNITSNIKLYSLAIGKNSNSTQDSSNQRLVVILGIADAGRGFDIDSMLQTELGKVKSFPFRLKEYSDYRFIHVRD